MDKIIHITLALNLLIAGIEFFIINKEIDNIYSMLDSLNKRIKKGGKYGKEQRKR